MPRQKVSSLKKGEPPAYDIKGHIPGLTLNLRVERLMDFICIFAAGDEKFGRHLTA